MNEREIFDQALAIDHAAKRSAFLDGACTGDAALREHLEELLSAYARMGSFLEAPLVAVPGAGDGLVQQQPGSMIGPYKLLERIGEGGFGIVFMAEQVRPVRRRVALKLVKPGMDTRQVTARFEAERQALALMDHPNIARVLDAGATDAGRPYFVMELVRGVPITVYCDEHQLTVRQRLGLFIATCHAVQHAHQKGIIHRDIKPSNVLITEHDGTPVPKVIDFGVAKALSGQLTDKTVFTGFSQLVGTPLYMSPEQTELSGLDVDTRSDIYSLGVLLYELLTATTPFEQERFIEVGYDEMRRIIREEEPAKPSKRLSTLGQAASTLATRRGSNPPALVQLCRGELDWIVMKTLEKDRRRRYETATALAADVERYLHDEPVSACPPSAAYRLRKFARRNRAALTAAALVFAASLLGTIVSSRQAIRATVAEDASAQLLKAETRERRRAVQAERQAQLRLLQSRLAQAEALRTSGQAGQRLKSWQAVTEAAQLAREMGLEKERVLELRNSAIASLALADVRLDKTGKTRATGWSQAFFDGDLKHYARTDQQGNIEVRRTHDDQLLCAIPKPANGVGPAWAQFSPDGDLLAVRHNPDLRIRLWDWRRESLVFESPQANFEAALAFSPDGRRLALGQSDGTITIHDSTDGSEVIEPIESGSPPTHLRYSPDGNRLAVLSSRDHQVQVLDAVNGGVQQVIAIPGAGPQLAWHPDGNLLAVGCEGRNILLWNLAAKTQHATLRGHQANAFVVGFAARGDILVSWAWDGTTRLWDIWAGRELVRFAESAYAINRDGDWLAGEPELNIHRWQVADSHEFFTLPKAKPTDNVEFQHGGLSPDGRWLALGTNQGVRVWDLAWRKELDLSPVPKMYTWDVKFHPSANELFTGSTDGLHRWKFQLKAGTLRIHLPQKLPLPPRQSQIGLDAAGRRLTSVDHSGGWILDMENPAAAARPLSHPSATFVAISADGRWAATGAHHGLGVKVWDAHSGTLVRHLIEDEIGARAVFSPDGKWLLTETLQDFRLWRTGVWDQIRRIPREQTLFNHGALFSPDSRLLALNVSITTVQLRDPATDRVWATLQAPDVGPVSLVGFSPDGSQLVLLAWTGNVVVWDLRRIRTRLKEIGLDWDLPEYAPADGAEEAKPARIERVEFVGNPDG